jgi:branched-subunit amino acid transport protein
MKKSLPFALVAVLSAIVVPSAWRIAKKAGYNPKLSLLALISPVNIILLAAFALSEWPIERELRLAKEQPPKT